MEQKSTGYLAFLQKFYDHGFLREVYRSDRTIVCNAYNQFYMIIDRTFLDKADGKYDQMIPVFVSGGLGLKEIIKDEKFAQRYYLCLPKEEQDKVLRFLDERLFQSFIKKDSMLKQKPVPEQMDLAFEAALLERGPDAMRAQLLAEEAAEKARQKSEKRSIFNFFKRKK